MCVLLSRPPTVHSWRISVLAKTKKEDLKKKGKKSTRKGSNVRETEEEIQGQGW
jgi:hypothetical protein